MVSAIFLDWAPIVMDQKPLIDQIGPNNQGPDQSHNPIDPMYPTVRSCSLPV